MDLDGYDFLDLGAREGGSLRMAQSVFGGQGLGVDIDKKNVETLRSKGFHGLVADATDLPLEDNSVRFCQALHFIEHLPDAEVAEKVIDQAIRVARDFVLVLGPDFSAKAYLNRDGAGESISPPGTIIRGSTRCKTSTGYSPSIPPIDGA